MQRMAVEGQLRIRTTATSRFSALAAAARGDMVLVNNEPGRFPAGKVDVHCEADAEPL